MKKISIREILKYAAIVFFVMVGIRSWDDIVGFVLLVVQAIIPLILGAAIAYIVSIPANFIERHMLPNSTSPTVEAARRPLSLVIAATLILATIVLATSVLIPAFIETVHMVQDRFEPFVETLLEFPIMRPFKDQIHTFLQGDLVRSITRLDFAGMVENAMGGTVGSIGTQVFGVVSTVMTGFFGLLFSFILLTDTTDALNKLMEVIATVLGDERTERMALVLGVADASFHNFIVRQCLEAAILGSVAAMTLFIVGFEYFLGVGVLMGLAALVPIVGYPVGLLVGGLMVVVTNPWYALIYIIVVAVAQVLEATFVLPHIGDPRTVLPPVWTTVGVTIGGGVAGFVGMLVAIPTASTIRQLILIDVRRRKAKQRAQRGEGAEAATQEELPDVESKTHPVASVELSDTEL